MAEHKDGDRVTNKTLYDELGKLRHEVLSRREGYLLVGGALVLGQVAARLNIDMPGVRVAASAVARVFF